MIEVAMRKRLGALALGAIAAAGCACAAPPAPTPAAAPAAARPKFGQNLGLTVSLGRSLAAGDTSVTAAFTLTNDGSSTFEGCFGPAWGVSVIVEGGHDAGYLVRVERPTCQEKLTLLPRQKIAWTKKVPLSDLRAGAAKVTGWVKLVDPATCDPHYGCRDTSIASAVTTIAIGAR